MSSDHRTGECWTIYVYKDGTRSMALSSIPDTQAIDVVPATEVERLRWERDWWRHRAAAWARAYGGTSVEMLDHAMKRERSALDETQAERDDDGRA